MAAEKVTRHYVQTYQWLKNQYTAWAANMRASRTYAARQGHTSNDAIGNALFMWACEQRVEELAKMLEPYLDRFQGVWDEKDGEERTGTAWLPGAVRHMEPAPAPRRRAEKDKPAEWAPGQRLEDEPKKGGRKPAG